MYIFSVDLFYYGNKILKFTQYAPLFQFSDVDISYLDELQDFCRDKISRQIERYGSKENLYLLCQQEEEEERKKKATQITTTTMVKTTKQEESPKKKKKINFSKVQVSSYLTILNDIDNKSFHIYFLPVDTFKTL